MLGIKPGQKLCRPCRNKVMVQDTDDSSVVSFEPVEVAKASLHDSLSSLGCSPLKLKRNKEDRVYYGKRKIEEIEHSAKEKVCKVLDISLSTLDYSDSEVTCNKCKDLDSFINLLKNKIIISSTQEKIKLLTLTPISWSIAENSGEI